MKLNLKSTHRCLKAALFASLCLALAACTKSGSISATSTSSNVSGAITVTSVYPTSSGNTWVPVKASNRYYIMGVSITIEGTCTRGINTVQVNEGGPNYTETATCADDGSWTWSKNYTSPMNIDKTLTLAAYDVSGVVISGTSTTVDVRIDDQPPAVPVVISPGTTPYTYTGAAFTFPMTGTCAADVDHLTGPGGTTIACSSGTWAYTAALVAGGSADYTFHTWDLAGNQSAGVTQTIAFIPSLSLLAGGVISGGTIADTHASGAKLESSLDFSPGKVTGTSGYIDETGFNYISNAAGAQ